jgi:hypothetical protein
MCNLRIEAFTEPRLTVPHRSALRSRAEVPTLKEVYSYPDTDLTLVQGVNFRSFTVKQAKSLGITGHVQNANDGTVCASRIPFAYIDSADIHA